MIAPGYAAYYMLHATCYRPQDTGCRLRATGYVLRTRYYRLQATGYTLHTIYCVLHTIIASYLAHAAATSKLEEYGQPVVHEEGYVERSGHGIGSSE